MRQYDTHTVGLCLEILNYVPIANAKLPHLLAKAERCPHFEELLSRTTPRREKIENKGNKKLKTRERMKKEQDWNAVQEAMLTIFE